MSNHLIFVYGTLKKDWGNNAIIADQECLGNATTTENNYQMYTLGGFPGVVQGNNAINGELWSVDEEAFARCDRLEGHPNFYKREQVAVCAESGQLHNAWIYIYQGSIEGRQPIEEWTHG